MMDSRVKKRPIALQYGGIMELTFYIHRNKTNNYRLMPEPIPFHELVLVLQGKMYYEIDGEEVELNERDAAYIPCGHVRSRGLAPDKPEYVSIHFLSDEPPALPRKMVGVVRGCVPHLIAAADSIDRRFGAPLWGERPLPLIEQLMKTLVQYLEDEHSRPKESGYVREMKQYMVDHLYSPFHVQDLAEHMSMSPSYCHAVFKKATGTPIMLYFNGLRLQEAKNLLALGGHSLADIVETLCFYDYNYFSRLFKKHFGVTPVQYKKQLYSLG